jgi:hypothetical protein
MTFFSTAQPSDDNIFSSQATEAWENIFPLQKINVDLISSFTYANANDDEWNLSNVKRQEWWWELSIDFCKYSVNERQFSYFWRMILWEM